MKKNVTFTTGNDNCSLDAAGIAFTYKGTNFKCNVDNRQVLDGTTVHLGPMESDMYFLTDVSYNVDSIELLHPNVFNLVTTIKTQQAIVIALLKEKLKLDTLKLIPTWDYSSNFPGGLSGLTFDVSDECEQLVVKAGDSSRGVGQMVFNVKSFNDHKVSTDIRTLTPQALSEAYNITGGEKGANSIKQCYLIQEVIHTHAELRLMVSPFGNIVGYHRNVVGVLNNSYCQANGTGVENSHILPLEELGLPPEFVVDIYKLAKRIFKNKHGALDIATVVEDINGEANVKSWSVFEYNNQFGTNITGGGTAMRDFMRQCIYEYATISKL